MGLLLVVTCVAYASWNQTSVNLGKPERPDPYIGRSTTHSASRRPRAAPPEMVMV